MVGTDLHGHAFPGATTPFGFVQLSPDTHTGDWDGCSGYHFRDKTVMGFSHTHLSGTGCGGLGDILLMPVVGATAFDVDAYTSPFSHANETAKPGYYKVFLDKPGVTAELTASPRVGVHRYSYPQSGDCRVVLDLRHGIQNDVRDTYLQVVGKNEVAGYRVSDGWGGRRSVFFVLRTNRPIDSMAIQKDGDLLGNTNEAKGKVVANLNFSGLNGQSLEVKVAISATSIENARKNLDAEVGTKTFAQVKAEATNTWSKELGKVKVESKDPAILRTYYSNVYLSLIAPNLFCDSDGTYRGADHKVHANPGFPTYSTFSLWDTYRAQAPMLTLWKPDVVDGMVNALVDRFYLSGGRVTPIWPLWDNETWCMIGVHAAPVVVDAYLKGLYKGDAEKAYQALKRTAMSDHSELNLYDKYGYVPTAPGRQASSKTMEYAYDDWCVARMAEALGHKEDAAYFYKRAGNFRNLYDTNVGFIRGRKEDGSWRPGFTSIGLVGDEYTESDAWHYTFAVQHDAPGLIQMIGGDRAFIAKMDAMFAASSKINTSIPDITGRIGQYSQGNEPCHHYIYLYTYAGAPYKTQKWVREAMRTQFGDGPDGHCGNVDCGQMSAWYCLSAIGIYPVNPASGVYVLGSPVVDKATIRLGKKPFVMEAVNNSPENVYVQSATFNGKPLDRTWITHEEIKSGGTLRFVMGNTPNVLWGASEAARPVSGMPKGYKYVELPTPSSNKYVQLQLPIRVVAGTEGKFGDFIADPNMLEGSTNRSNNRIDVSAPNAAPEQVYQSERYGDDFSFRFTVPVGKEYTVRLHFAEVFGDEPGQRIAEYYINDILVLPNFDVVKEAGAPNKAVVKEFTGIKPNAKGQIVIRIKAKADSPDQNAKISGIEILP